MKAPRKFFEPLAIGAPAPHRESPTRLERMIHFVPPHIEKLRAKANELAAEVDVVLGNLEDAIPVEQKAAAREGFIAMAQAHDFGSTGPVGARQCAQFAVVSRRHDAARRRNRRQAGCRDGSQDRGRLGHSFHRSISRLARGALWPQETDPRPRHPRDRAGRQSGRGDRRGLAAHAWNEFGAGGSRRFAGDEDDAASAAAIRISRARRRRPRQARLAASAQQDLWHYTVARMVDACAANGIKPFYGPFGDFADAAGCEAQFRNAFLMGCAGAWTLASEPDRDRQAGLFARSGRGRFRQARSWPPCPTGRGRS